jgi:SAM-dependent methyltransferase
MGERFMGLKRDCGAVYTTIHGKNNVIQGRRDPYKRIRALEKVYDFSQKTVVDIGCNSGGMLFALQSQGSLKKGFGYEISEKCLNIARDQVKMDGLKNIKFIEQDLTLPIVKEYPKCDIAFMFSVANWVGQWRYILRALQRSADCVAFEANGRPGKQLDQIDFLHGNFDSVRRVLIDAEDGNIRRLFLCR